VNNQQLLNYYSNPQSYGNDIKITNSFISLGSLDEKLRLNEINIDSNSFSDYHWGIEKMSRLIESILLRIPLPIFYFDVSNPYIWLSINGVQKLRTIEIFMENNLELVNMEILTDLNGVSYHGLDNYYKRILYDTQIITYQIEAQTPEYLRELVFKKIRDMNEN
jgi:hypothetical protein